MQRGARQADRAQRLATQLRQAGEDVLDAGTRLGDVAIASLLRFGQCFLLGSLTLDIHAPVLAFEARFTFAIDAAFVGVDVAAGVGCIDHRLEVQRPVLAGGTDHEFSDYLATLVGLSLIHI